MLTLRFPGGAWGAGKEDCRAMGVTRPLTTPPSLALSCPTSCQVMPLNGGGRIRDRSSYILRPMSTCSAYGPFLADRHIARSSTLRPVGWTCPCRLSLRASRAALFTPASLFGIWRQRLEPAAIHFSKHQLSLVRDSVLCLPSFPPSHTIADDTTSAAGPARFAWAPVVHIRGQACPFFRSRCV